MSPEQLEQIIDAVAKLNTEPHWTTYVGLVLAILGAFFAYYQLSKIAEQISDARIAIQNDHERSRRAATVEVLRYFQEFTTPEHNKMVKLLDLMPEDQLVCLRDAKTVSLEGELKELACSALRPKFPDIYDIHCQDEKRTTFTHGQSLQLRYIMINVVNHIEVCLVPWRLGIVDTEEFENQFKALVDKRDGKYKLARVRAVIGIDKFPATEAFRAHLFPESAANTPKKPIAS